MPDHSTFSNNRHGRFRDSDLLRKLFETTVERRMAQGLVGGEGFAVDASLIRADANRQTGGPGSEGLPPNTDNRVAREYLAVLDDVAFGAGAYSTNYLIDLDHAVIMDGSRAPRSGRPRWPHARG